MNFFRRFLFSFSYLGQPPWDTQIVPPEVKTFIAQYPPGKALDLGCGTGTNAIALAKKQWRVTGIDFAPNAIRSAQRKARNAGVEVDFRVGDVTRLNRIRGPFNLILDIGCYHNLTKKGMLAYRDNLNHLLGPQGIFLIYVFFSVSPTESGPGVVEADLNIFSPPLTLVSRVDSLERGTRPAAWLTFQKEAG